MRILVTGHRGFLGQHVVDRLYLAGHQVRTGAGRGDGAFDLRSTADTAWLFRAAAPVDVVIHLACPTPGGIGAMAQHPTICADMARIDANVIEACNRFKVGQVITVGSVCSFPERVPIPATELDLFNGPPEATNAPYGEAKRFTWTLLEAFRREYRLASTYLVLSNLYGPGDRSQHLIPSTIRKILGTQRTVEALAALGPISSSITCWGDGSATRDLLYVEDAAAGILAAIGKPSVNPILLCDGREFTVARVVEQIAETLSFSGTVRWDATQPTGQYRRYFRSLGAAQLAWTPLISLVSGIQRTIQWWKENPE